MNVPLISNILHMQEFKLNHYLETVFFVVLLCLSMSMQIEQRSIWMKACRLVEENCDNNLLKMTGQKTLRWEGTRIISFVPTSRGRGL